MEKAIAEGSAIKQVSFDLNAIGVDGGAMIMPNGWGSDVRPMRDGTVQFLFEVEDGQAVSAQAETYTIELEAVVRNVSADGEVDYENPIRQTWTVEVQPQSFAKILGTSLEATDTPALATVDGSATQPRQVIVPEAYTQTGTLPVYKATARNFVGKLDYTWFNQSGVASEEVYANHTGGLVLFNDEAQLSWSAEAVFYETYDGTYEATSFVIEGREEKPVTETLKKRTMTSEACSLASWMHFGFPGTEEVYSLERTELTNITLEEAKAKVEALLAKLGLDGYICTTALDMSLERIQTMGNELNRQIDLENLSTNSYRYDYSTATVANEGYYLQYHKYGTEGDIAGLFSGTFYVTADGVMEVNLRDYYQPGEILHTPEKLLDVVTIANQLPKEMANARWPETLVEIHKAELTWMPMRADVGQEMVMSPVWVFSYVSDAGEQRGYAGWAVFNAIDGKLVAAVFN